ncbi:hypothetical protein [Shewanella oncorhynchi]|uniref:hypothetical protein n=1 Tax=Shewanella oncorhynchi TaxID=2726434 RepID=UPI003D7B4DF8
MRYKVMLADAYGRRGVKGPTLGTVDDVSSRLDMVFEAVLSHKPQQQIKYPDQQMIKRMDGAFISVGKKVVSVNNLKNTQVPIGMNATIQALPSK